MKRVLVISNDIADVAKLPPFIEKLAQEISLADDLVFKLNLALEEALARDGITFERTPVGDKYISNKMFEQGYSLGGEQSGHFIINAYLATGDAILSALCLLGILLGVDGTLQPIQKLTLVPQMAIALPAKKAIVEDSGMMVLAEEARVDMEGEGRIIVRMSGTEPKVRVMVEAPTVEICEKHVSDVVAAIEKGGYVL